MYKFREILGLVFVIALLIGGSLKAFAQEAPEAAGATAHLTMRAGEVFFSEDVAVEEGDSVLDFLERADEASDIFSLSNVEVFSFGSYLKCVNIESIGEKCDDWQYTIDGNYASTSIDQTSLDEVGNIYFYFSAKNRITLNDDSITTSDTLVVTVEQYDYEEGVWVVEDDVTIGVTQPDPSGPYNPPIEIMTGEVDGSGNISFNSIPEGTYDIGIRDEYGYYFPTKPLTVTIAPETTSSSGSHSSGGSRKNERITELPATEIKTKFDIKKAFEFLLAQQKENGSFEEELYTDWAALALASGNYQKETIKLIKYLGETKTTGTLLTDFERRVMSLMALGLNPYDTNGENYIEKIISSFDGKQFGDVNEDNDDIFALIVLTNAGYTIEDKMIADDISFVLGRQRENGSWDESVDMTGAGIQALANFSPTPGVGESLDKAKKFLKQSQKKNGGWEENASSTAWAIQGLNALGEGLEDWEMGGNTPLDYLTTIQDVDGGIKNLSAQAGENLENRIWQTAYVISALSGKTWNQIMQNFERVGSLTVTEQPKQIAIKPKIIKPKSENLVNQNTATVINSAASESEPKVEDSGWFLKLISKIFSVF